MMHGIMFSGKQEEELETAMGRFLKLIDNQHRLFYSSMARTWVCNLCG
jgi:hypothetical protein